MDAEKDKVKRAGGSCTECQRRKQKCSREWPCNHCQARRVAHLCQFGHKKIQEDSDSNCISTTDPKRRKRSLTESTKPLSADSGDVPESDVEHGLKAWGYMPGHDHWQLSTVDKQVISTFVAEPVQSAEVEKALHAIPPRSLTDALVKDFLNGVNNRYSTIYGPTFTEQYAQWWSDRAIGRRLSPEFTCLLLRVLAYSVQFLSHPLRKTVEFELACSCQTLTDRLADAAEQLSSTVPASRPSLERIQEQFLKGCWLKSESRIVESWHCLSSTIREAQELGINKLVAIEGLSEFDIEIRRRMWTLLYVWDWQMSAWLGRPHLIDQKDCDFILPNLRLDSDTFSDALSPFAHITLQAMLARSITPHMGNNLSLGDLSVNQILGAEAECQTFIAQLPPVFRLDSPDLSLDQTYPFYTAQRFYLHVIIYMTRLYFFKSYLTRDRKDLKSPYTDQFRATGIDLALRLMAAARKQFEYEFPINAKWHIVLFSVFDTATLLCSAIIHDRGKSLPRRQEAVDAVEEALGMLQRLSKLTKIGCSSYNFLCSLTRVIPEISKHEPDPKRRRVVTDERPAPEIPDPGIQELTHSAPLIGPAESEVPTDLDPIIPGTGIDDLSFGLNQFVDQNAFDNASQFDMGGMEAMWDWDALNLDDFLNQDPGPPPQ